MKNIKYKVLEHNDEPIHTLIHKTGNRPISAKFTLKDLVDEIKKIKGSIVAKQAEADVHAAEMQNVLKNYPQLQEIEEKLQQAIYVYIEAKINNAAAQETVNILQKDYDLDVKELKQICKTLHLPEPVL